MRIQLKMSDELAAALGQPIADDGIYAISVIALAGMLAVRFGFQISVESFVRNHITTQLGSAAAHGFSPRESAGQLAFDLAAFFKFSRPEDMGEKDILAWLTAIFKVYFDIRYESGEDLTALDPLDVQGWGKVLLDAEFIGLANLPDPRIANEEGQLPLTIGIQAIHMMVEGTPPDVYPEDLIPYLEIDPALIETSSSAQNETTAALSEVFAEETFL